MNHLEFQRYLEDLSSLKEALYQTISRRVSRNDALTMDAIEYRRNLLSENDVNVASAYLSLGICTELCTERRLAAICIVLEAEFIRDKNNIVKKCTPYDSSSKLIQKCPGLSDYVRKDLISTKGIKRDEKSSAVVLPNGKWGRIDGSLSGDIYDWLINHIGNPSYVRINPSEIFEQKPQQLILEFLLTPPNPKWWHNLKIYNRTKEGCAFFLSGGDISNRDDYWDYNVRGIRGLQVITSRDNNGNLSMMLEELSEQVFVLDPSRKIVTGRMIHLDTDAVIGTPFENAKLNHLDLAMNYYFDDAAERRLSENLATGQKVEDATERTHVARIENILFPDLFFAAYGFLQSKILVDEWKNSQFI